MKYNLFVPENYDPEKKYPLVLFIPDATGGGSHPRICIEQGNGAVNFASPRDQAKHPCFVLSVQYDLEGPLTRDDFTVNELGVTQILSVLDHVLAKWPIDLARVYTTGQSMGCMTSCELNIRRPDLFAASLLVAGQWDPEKMGKLSGKNFWILVSEHDEKAFPGMNAIVAAFERNGGEVGKYRWNAKADAAILNHNVEEAAKEPYHLRYTVFEGDSVVPEGVRADGRSNHMSTWPVVYAIDALRDWLLEQVNPKPETAPEKREATPIQAGFGQSEIVFPKALFPVEGFVSVHDNPCARLMTVEAGGKRVCVASLELVMLPDFMNEKCRKEIAALTGTDYDDIWLHVTHAITTMHEPGPKGPPRLRQPETDEDRRKLKLYSDAILAAVHEAAAQAAQSFGPAQLGVGEGTSNVNVNRDVETPYGWWTGLNPEGFSNKGLTVLRFDDLSGKTKGVLVNYGIKPCAIDISEMDAGTRQVSADVCGVCCRWLEEKLGVPALFCVSAAGDQVPREMTIVEHALGEGKSERIDQGVAVGLEMAQRLGKELGEDVLKAVEATVCDQATGVIEHRKTGFGWRAKQGRPPRGPMPPAREWPDEGEATFPFELITLNDVALLGEKPEVNAVTEAALKKASPYKHTCLVCMVNGGMKYMPDQDSYARNTFEAQNSMLQPGAAERMVDVAAQLLAAMKEGE